jgi:hypothetical protein
MFGKPRSQEQAPANVTLFRAPQKFPGMGNRNTASVPYDRKYGTDGEDH